MRIMEGLVTISDFFIISVFFCLIRSTVLKVWTSCTLALETPFPKGYLPSTTNSICSFIEFIVITLRQDELKQSE